MLLMTTIAPRRDGTVVVRGRDDRAYVFAPDAAGDLVCDIDDDETIARVLRTGDFEPVDVADHAHAAELLMPPAVEDDEEEEEDDEPDENAPPVEADTAPAPAKAARGRGKRGG